MAQLQEKFVALDVGQFSNPVLDGQGNGHRFVGRAGRSVIGALRRSGLFLGGRQQFPDGARNPLRELIRKASKDGLGKFDNLFGVDRKTGFSSLTGQRLGGGGGGWGGFRLQGGSPPNPPRPPPLNSRETGQDS